MLIRLVDKASVWLTIARMKPIAIKNEYGETIEIKFNADGVIKIRHSDIDPKAWGELREYSKGMNHPQFKAVLEAKGIPVTPDTIKLAGKMGGYIVLRGQSKIINANEVALIHEAVKKAGGIVPNWMNR